MRYPSSLLSPGESRDDGSGSEWTFAQARHICRPRTRRRPMEAAIFFGNRNVVDAGLAPAHQAVLVELPLLVAVGAVPLAGRVVPLVLEAHGDTIAVKRPKILDQAIVEFPGPFPREKCDDGCAPFEDFGAVAPAAVLGIGERDAFGVA